MPDRGRGKGQDKGQVTRISVSLPDDLLRELDERIIRRG